MKSATISLKVPTSARAEMVDVTARLVQAIQRSEITDGLAIVSVPHTTAGVAINENADPDVRRDVIAKLDRLIPKDEPFYRHGEGNSDSHVKTILTGNSVLVLIANGRPLLGRWQGVYLMEFDGPRTRDVVVRLVDHGRPSPS